MRKRTPTPVGGKPAKTDSTPPNVVEEAERLAAEKAATDEAERVAAEKAAAEEAERLAAEKALVEEAERLAAENGRSDKACVEARVLVDRGEYKVNTIVLLTEAEAEECEGWADTSEAACAYAKSLRK